MQISSFYKLFSIFLPPAKEENESKHATSPSSLQTHVLLDQPVGSEILKLTTSAETPKALSTSEAPDTQKTIRNLPDLQMLQGGDIPEALFTEVILSTEQEQPARRRTPPVKAIQIIDPRPLPSKKAHTNPSESPAAAAYSHVSTDHDYCRHEGRVSVNVAQHSRAQPLVHKDSSTNEQQGVPQDSEGLKQTNRQTNTQTRAEPPPEAALTVPYALPTPPPSPPVRGRERRRRYRRRSPLSRSSSCSSSSSSSSSRSPSRSPKRRRYSSSDVQLQSSFSLCIVFYFLLFCLTGVQRAVRLHRLTPTPLLGTTGGLTQGPDPGQGPGHHPEPVHRPRRYARGGGEMFIGQLKSNVHACLKVRLLCVAVISLFIFLYSFL